MKTISTLYNGKKLFQECIETKGIVSKEECLVRIYTPSATKEEALLIAKEIKEMLPKAKIIGASGSGIIFKGKQYEDETLVVVEQFENTKIKIYTTSFEKKTAKEVALGLLSVVEEEKVLVTHVLFGEHYYDVHNFVEEFNKNNKTTKLVGGVVGDILSKKITGYVFTENEILDNGMVSAILINENLYAWDAVNNSHKAISPIYTVNKTEGNYLLEIEGKSAVEWCKEQFGMEDLSGYSEWNLIAQNDALIRFPLMLEEHNGASRFVKYDPEAEKMSLYFSEINKDMKFRIGYTNPMQCVQECFDICGDITAQPVESLFCYTCLFRKLYLENCAEWELRPFAKEDVAGVFMMGEIAYVDGKNEFLNGSCTLVGIAENQTFITPDFSVFEDLYKITDDNQKLSTFIIQKQSVAMSSENQQLLAELMRQHEIANENLYLDINTGIFNTLRYTQDNQKYHFEKMCMVQIENAHLHIAKYGQSYYYSIVRKALSEIYSYTNTLKEKDDLYFYTLNETTVFLVAGIEILKDRFMEIVNDLYGRFRLINSHDTENLLINRFVVVCYENNLLEKAIATLRSSENLQTHFLLYDRKLDESQYLEDEMKKLQVINLVIQKNRVVPYFQGIYDNEKKCICKYEALMRIVDENEKVYAPVFFMETAKKYHMYSEISRQMIEKIFHLFAGTKVDVSINLSAYDINFPQMREFIFESLEKIEDASNFIFEILEDEQFRDLELLKTFIAKARTYGVRIAVDDFGSGYSNFVELAKISPDFIKVDGSIILRLEPEGIHEKVLNSIVFLGKQIKAQLVAEFVENEKIQNQIEKQGIRYSQGYYFAKPVPFDKIQF